MSGPSLLASVRAHVLGVVVGSGLGLAALLVLILGLEITGECDSFFAPPATAGCAEEVGAAGWTVTLIGLMGAFVLAGAVAARIGDAHSMLRGAIAAQLTCAIAIVLAQFVAVTPPSAREFLVFAVGAVPLATFLGLSGSYLSKRFP